MTFNIFNIAYDQKSFDERDPFFETIGDLSNPSPELFEYHHILRFYEERRQFWSVDEYYGFLSPNFFIKTGMEGRHLIDELEKISTEAKEIDVILLNPWWRLFQSSMNSFDQAEDHHPGLLQVFESVLHDLKLEFSQHEYFSYSLNTTYSNFFVAKPHIWDMWIKIIKAILSIAADSSSALGSRLNEKTKYKSGVNPKIMIFVLERVINVLLVQKIDPSRVSAVDPFIFSKDKINFSPSYMRNIDKLRLDFSEGRSRSRSLVFSPTWELKKLNQIITMVNRKYLRDAVDVISNERFSPLFAGEVEILKVKILVAAGQFNEALMRLNKTEFAKRDYDVTRESLLYRVLVKLGKFAEAKSKIEELDVLYPGSHVLGCDLATVMLLMEDHINLSKKIDSLMVEFPSSWLVPYIGSKFLFKIGDAAKAQELVNLSIRLKSSPRRLEWNFM
ncbi:MAG: hypothetical protein EBU82_09630 [Flavobacteriia bacterium]|nr:hypothetical protein [Flavobacteriia bacterium]